MAITSATLSMPAGTSIEIKVPSDPSEGQGVFPKKEGDKVKVKSEERDHVLGFVSEKKDVGTIEKVEGTDELKIRYSHTVGEENRLHFFTASDESYIINILAIPIHDHSSIQQGGPAYGSYYYNKAPQE